MNLIKQLVNRDQAVRQLAEVLQSKAELASKLTYCQNNVYSLEKRLLNAEAEVRKWKLETEKWRNLAEWERKNKSAV